GDAALEVRVAVIEDRHTQCSLVMRNPRQLVLVPSAEEPQPVHDVELPGVQQVQPEAARVEDHIVAVIELVDIHRQPRHGRHDRRAHRGVRDHPVLFPLAGAGDRHDRRGQITQELVGAVGLEHTSRYMSTVDSLPQRVLAHIRKTRLFREPGEALVAVSGGADSVALLDLLNSLRAELGLALVVAHVDHGISSDSRTVGLTVRAIAKKYRLPFETTELHLGADASETEARRARYAWLRELQHRRGATYIVTAHHEDDQVETIVLRALHGSAPAGLAGIRAKSRGGLVRPLLPFSRRELADYAA